MDNLASFETSKNFFESEREKGPYSEPNKRSNRNINLNPIYYTNINLLISSLPKHSDKEEIRSILQLPTSQPAS